MNYRIVVKSFVALSLIAIFSVQAHASEVTGTLSSGITQNGSGSSTSSEVSGTLGNGVLSTSSTLTGTVFGSTNDGGSSGGNRSGSRSGSGGGSSGSNSGSVLGVSTTGVTTIPGFPNTGVGLLAYLDYAVLVLVMSTLLLASYSLYRRPAQS